MIRTGINMNRPSKKNKEAQKSLSLHQTQNPLDMIKDYQKAVELLKETRTRIRNLSPEDRSDYCQYGNGSAVNLALEEWLERIDDSLFEDLDKLSKDVGAEIITWASADHEPVFDCIGHYNLDQDQTVVLFKPTSDEIYEVVISVIKGQMMNLNKKKHQKVMMEVEPDEGPTRLSLQRISDFSMSSEAVARACSRYSRSFS